MKIHFPALIDPFCSSVMLFALCISIVFKFVIVSLIEQVMIFKTEKSEYFVSFRFFGPPPLLCHQVCFYKKMCFTPQAQISLSGFLVTD